MNKGWVGESPGDSGLNPSTKPGAAPLVKGGVPPNRAHSKSESGGAAHLGTPRPPALRRQPYFLLSSFQKVPVYEKLSMGLKFCCSAPTRLSRM